MGASFPLAMANADDTVTVVKVKGDGARRQHLAELGFVEGAEVTVVSKAGSDLIVNVKGAKLGINREISMKVYVE